MLLHFHAKKTDTTQNSSIYFEEGLTQLITPIYHFVPLAHAAPQFLKELTPPPPSIPTILRVRK